MPFDVNGFRSRFKDSLPTTHYEVTITPPVGGGQEINLRTESVSLPGTAYLSVDNYSPSGNGLLYNLPYRYNPQEITMTHTIDEKGDIYKTFFNWSRKIVDFDGEDSYGAHYHEDYVTDAFIFVYNRKLEPTNVIQLIECYPTVVQPVSLSWAQNDEIAKLEVSYRFTRFKVLK